MLMDEYALDASAKASASERLGAPTRPVQLSPGGGVKTSTWSQFTKQGPVSDGSCDNIMKSPFFLEDTKPYNVKSRNSYLSANFIPPPLLNFGIW